MQRVRGIELIDSSGEELLAGFAAEFPYLASRAELDFYPSCGAPWHWHRPVELFYIESGTLEYTTPNETRVFPAGSGGFIGSNVLHASRVLPSQEETVTLLHLFAPELLSGGADTRIHEKYIRPLLDTPGAELIALRPEIPREAAILDALRASFELDETAFGYELQLRERLTNIWLSLWELAQNSQTPAHRDRSADAPLKAMLRFIHTHYAQPVTIDQIAAAAPVSRRVCFRLFQEHLHTTPLEYLTDCRLQNACRMLLQTGESVTQIAYACGLGSSSYFGKRFRERFGCTPAQFRQMARS